ncbi:relaxase/mobilization nuclease domain-containing protein [Aureibaculum sp. 2210JD6-5]|uniref:relaxase/mobilization nuclease domain-containing protein n=1 Tax=Aureibaculum sp. 2210JD6-5 TaxID=3103957 RepID=UPI002AAE9459|nr:relaxase/mobilization nuclease domain-containing protein [Aureibaculum sp. 2210JD6-5]MDY7396298.1 relaxase/mobilization nuclease domain-containing protein [Aureibaculum sp. 2210JD6-5]
MIGKGKAISQTTASISYGWNQEKDAEVILKQHLIGDSPSEISKEFKIVQDMNYRCKKNTLSFIISPTIKDGEKLKIKDLHEIAQKFIAQMKLGERQAIAFVHQDKKHKHIHLYVNRIDFKGKAYNDSFVGKKSQLAAERVAEDMKLTTVKQVQFEKEFLLKDVRREIKRRHDLTVKQFAPKSFDDYIECMRVNGVTVIPSVNKANTIQGFRFEFDNYNLKGSEVHRSMSGAKIGQQLYSNSKSLDNEIPPLKILNNNISLAPKLALDITKKLKKK